MAENVPSVGCPQLSSNRSYQRKANGTYENSTICRGGGGERHASHTGHISRDFIKLANYAREPPALQAHCHKSSSLAKALARDVWDVMASHMLNLI